MITVLYSFILITATECKEYPTCTVELFSDKDYKESLGKWYDQRLRDTVTSHVYHLEEVKSVKITGYFQQVIFYDNDIWGFNHDYIVNSYDPNVNATRYIVFNDDLEDDIYKILIYTPDKHNLCKEMGNKKREGVF